MRAKANYLRRAGSDRPPWCGQCDERTRRREDVDGANAGRCPACNPLAERLPRQNRPFGCGRSGCGSTYCDRTAGGSEISAIVLTEFSNKYSRLTHISQQRLFGFWIVLADAGVGPVKELAGRRVKLHRGSRESGGD